MDTDPDQDKLTTEIYFYIYILERTETVLFLATVKYNHSTEIVIISIKCTFLKDK